MQLHSDVTDDITTDHEYKKSCSPTTVQVIQEYKSLSGLPSDIPVPHAVYASSTSDEATVGRAFIIMEFVSVCRCCVKHPG